LDCIRYIKTQLKHLKDKRINEVNVYCGSYLPEWRPGVDYKSTYSAIPELGGGVHLDLIHELDYLYWLFGNPVAVNRTYRNSSTLGIAAFDYANYLMDYDRFCANVILNYFRKEPKRSMEIVFADETWEIDLLRNQVVCNNKILFTSHQRIADTYIPQIKYFIDCINSKSKTMNTVNDAFNVLKICIES
jgi:predicted dehydrogenase